MAADDLTVGAADADGQRAHQYRAVGKGRIADVVDPRRVGNAGRYGQRAHWLVSRMRCKTIKQD
jgi:hypothetical protein